MITIRRAVNSDIDAIFDLLAQVLAVHNAGRPDIFKANSRKYTRDELILIINDENSPLFVAENEFGKVVAHAFTVIKQEISHNILTDIKSLYIDDICVDENCRGENVGSTIYNYVLDYAKSNGFYNITLNVWNCNDSALAFYQKMGLVPQKTTLEKIL